MNGHLPARLLVCLVVVSTLGSAPAAHGDRLEYGRDVRPILAEKCFHCHGQDSKTRMAGLRLDVPDGATADRGGRVAVVPGKPESSVLYQRITASNGALRMPPAYSNRSLTDRQIGILKRWIAEGGRYSQHWAFEPPRRPMVPKTNGRTWVKNAIDSFVLKRLETEGLTPRPAASPNVWLRRVALDLVGLPPTPAEIDAFSKDVKLIGEAAYAAAVDRLLASPRYGERMAMEWLDVARYADTHGFNNDSERSMWRWRDWVIESFNANLPYDRFLTEQLAGDLLPSPTLEQRIATGFGRNHVINSEGGIIEEEYRVEYVADRVRTLGMAWMGLTLECARCHDHKYDPITQRDHYRFQAFFNNVPELGEDGRVANAVPFMPAPTRDQEQKLRELESEIGRLDQTVKSRRQSSTVKELSATRVAALAGAADLALGDGIVANGRSGAGGPKRQTDAVKLSRRLPFTLSLWLEPMATDTDVALLSSINYATSEAATSYGSGIELRLVAGELEFRYAQRFPAYSMRVRSEGAQLAPGGWRHATLVYQGVGSSDPMRAPASWVQIFVDGRELPTRVLNDGMQLPEATADKPSAVRFRIGWDNKPASVPFAGQLDEIEIWTRRLADSDVLTLFESRALPYAFTRLEKGKASTGEAGWLRDALLRQRDPVYSAAEKELRARRSEWLALCRGLPTVMVMEDMASPRQTHVLLRGAYNAPGEKVDPGVPEALLGAWPPGAPRNRLGLARWLTKPDHPLTARVVTNRYWQQLFGQGLVKTSENFGLQGESPSHPELLDWLAREFIDSGWNVKALLKQIVLSATYRQDSAASLPLIARDPENRLLARGPRFRLPAELLRDQALSVSGLLKERLGGPSVHPYQPAGLYKGMVVAAQYPGTRWVESKGDDLYRRSLYTYWKRTVPHPTLTVFDAPDREFCIVRRAVTNTPLQALTMLNDPIFVEAARKLAERAIHEGGSTPEGRLAMAFRLAVGRSPDSQEQRILRTALDKMLAAYRADEQGARALLGEGASASDAAIPPPELAAYAAVAGMILNLDEVVTKG